MELVKGGLATGGPVGKLQGKLKPSVRTSSSTYKISLRAHLMLSLTSVQKFIVGAAATIAAIFAISDHFRRATVNDFSGWWDASFKVVSSSYRPYEGAVYGYKIFLTQDGDKLIGHGEMRTADGESLPSSKRTRIEMVGTAAGLEAQFTYTLKGDARDTFGSFTLRKTDDEGMLAGDFRGTAADARGTVVAVKTTE